MLKDKVTLSEVAKLAGVSQSAVSRAFTPGASVSTKTRLRIEKAVEELGYKPNLMARAMATGRSKVVGLVISYLENQFYPMAIELLSRKLQQRGYHILIIMSDNQEHNLTDEIDELLDYRVAGIITASVAIDNDLTLSCEAAGIPIVMFNRGQDDDRLSSVTSDNVAGGRLVANYLVAGGHERIAHISGWQKSSTGRDRMQGFLAGLAEHGREAFAVVDGLYNAEEAKKQTRLLFGGANRPDAVFVGNDHMALAVLDVLRFELGLKVPDDVSVVGYDDVPIASWPTYDLTTVRQCVTEMVDATVEALLSRIEGHAEPYQLLIAGDLIERGSAKKPKDFNQ